jgi:hypothetical protein
VGVEFGMLVVGVEDNIVAEGVVVGTLTLGVEFGILAPGMEIRFVAE